MKKQYAIAVLLLVGLGIVSTMAFDFGSLSSEEVSKAYEVSTASSMSVGKVKIKFITPDKMKIDISSIVNGGSNYDLVVSLGSTSGVTLSSVTSTEGTPTVDDADDYFEETGIATSTTSVTYIVSGTDIWTDTTAVYISINTADS